MKIRIRRRSDRILPTHDPALAPVRVGVSEET